MSQHNPPMYVRIKRRKQTVFLHCDVNETITAIKGRVQLILGVPPTHQRLLLGKQVLEDHATLADCGIDKDKDDAVFYLCTRVDDGQSGEEQWEELEIVSNPNSPAAGGAATAPPPAAS
eukprot:PhF_6_TR19531/c0_g1_i1/m.28502/K03873/TCEB2; transcription elongation factor B, polypeptide 2